MVPTWGEKIVREDEEAMEPAGGGSAFSLVHTGCPPHGMKEAELLLAAPSIFEQGAGGSEHH